MSEVVKKDKFTFPVMFQKIKDYAGDGDERFTKVRIWLMHLGRNFNGSIFEKQFVDEALPTLEYIPIVGFIESNKIGDEDFSDHRFITVNSPSGSSSKYLGIPYGVIKSIDDNNAHYEERLCDDGITRTFLVVDGLLWNMFDGAEIMNRDYIKSHSMELWDKENSFEGYEDEDGLFHFTKFSFRAACILGEDYDPGMTNSTIEVQFTLGEFVNEIQNELTNKLTTFSKLIEKENDKEGGTGNMSDKIAKTEFVQTAKQQFDDISAIVSEKESITSRWGEALSRFGFMDIQDSEVIVFDRKNNYQTYGFSFTVDGDKPIVDFASGKRKKVLYADYVDGSTVPDSAFSFEKLIIEQEDRIAELMLEAGNKSVEYTKLQNELAEIKPQFEKFVNAEQDRIAKETEENKLKKIAEYEAVIAEEPEFAAIKEIMADLTTEEIDGKCAIIYARKTLHPTNFSKNEAQSGIVEIIENGEQNRTGYAFSERYGEIPIG